MSEPLISVVVATYHRKDPLERALESLAAQTYPFFEVVLVDDNADATWNRCTEDIAERFRRTCSRIPLTYIQNKENRGSAETRNTGIRAAAGKYVTFLDDDDVYLPDKLKNQMESMEKTEADYGITNLFLYNENDKLIDKRIRTYIATADHEPLMSCHLKYHMTGTDTMMFRRDYLLRIGCFDAIDVGDEFYLMHKAIRAGGKLAYLDRCDVKAYVHTGDGGLSSGQSKIDGENQLYEFKKKYFSEINAKCRRYIRMRHYAVLALAEYRQRNWLPFMINMVKCGASAPLQCIGMIISHKLG